ncbi:MAG: TniQ family protein [Bacteroidia bacterium]
MPLFPAFVKPKKDELFSSWVVRLAHAHEMKVYTFTKLFLGNRQFWNRDIDRSVSEESLKILATKSNCTYIEIFQTTLRSYEGILFEKDNLKSSSKWILPLGIYHRTWKNHGLMFCPNCLKKDGNEPYFRKYWRLSLYTICCDCKCYLIDRCPNCNKPVSFFRSELGNKIQEPERRINQCYNCNYNLAKIKITKVKKALWNTQLKIQNHLQSVPAHFISPLNYFNAFRCVIKIFASRRRMFLNAQQSLSMQFKFRYQDRKGGFANRFEVLSIEERAEILNAMIWLFENWPYRFIKVFKSLKFYSSDLFRDCQNLPEWYTNVIYQQFFLSNSARKNKE